jgi:PAS domain S-box-containing protein
MFVDSLPIWGIGYVLGNVGAAVLAGAIAYYAWQNRTEPGATQLTGIMIGAAVWCALVVLHVLSESVWLTHLFVRMIYPTLAFVIACWFAFGLEFTGREQYLTRRTMGVLAIHPVAVTLVVVFAPELLWTTVESSDSLIGIQTELGPFFSVHFVYAYGLIVIGVVLLLEYATRTRSVYRGQGLAVLVAVITPVLANAISLAGIVPVDLSAISYVVTGLAFTWAIFNYKLMDLSPIARDKLVDEIDDGMFVLDREERFTDLNPAAERLLDVDRDEALGETAQTIFSEYSELYEQYNDVERTQDEIEIRVGDEVRTFELTISPLYDSHDRLVARQFLLHDSTHQRRRQKSLEHKNEQLERFASVVSHDLRNPINVARGYVDVARETEDLEPLDEVEYSFDRMEAIIEDVLTMAREGQEMNDPEPVELETVARDAWEHVDTGESTLEITGTMTIKADRNKLQRALENLLRNALDHSEEALTITVGPIERDTGSSLIDRNGLGFFVADDGPGIPEDERDKVLEAGYTTASDGTGLGLSIVQSIAEAHGWTIEITESAAGGARIELRGVVQIEKQDGSDTDPSEQRTLEVS